MLVKEIKELPSKKRKVIFEEGEEWTLYAGEIRKYHIKESCELSGEICDEIYHEVLGKRAKKRAMHLLEKTDRTEKNLRDKLKQNGYPEELIDMAVNYVKEYHYIDDLRYAKNYVRYRQQQKSAGRLKLDLMQRGVAKDLIEEALEEEFLQNEFAMIRQILEKKGYRSGTQDKGEQRRMYQYLLRRGYKNNDILHALKCDDYLT